MEKSMVIVVGFPPNIEEIKKVFNLEGKKPVFAYNPILFNPYNANIDEYLKTHELIHFAQQGNDPSQWWSKYLKEPDFRLSQELEAYQWQYNSYKQIVKDRNNRHEYRHRISIDLSSEMYGNIISYEDAMKKIK